MLRFIVGVIVVCLFSCSSDVTEETKVIESKKEVVEAVPFESLNFTMNQPEGWGYKLNTQGSELLMVDKTCETCRVKSVITVIKFSNTDSLKFGGVVDFYVNSMKDYYHNFTLNERNEVDLNGLNAQRISYTVENNQKDSIGVVAYVFMFDGNYDGYILSCTGDNKGKIFKDKIAFFDETCQSFKLN